MRIAIIGRSEILYETTQTLSNAGHDIVFIITSKEAPEYTKTAYDFEELARSYGAQFIKTSKIATTLDAIRAQDTIDIGVSLNYSGIIPKEIIDCFPLGILNAHGGDLPRYRGNACQAWAILNGEKKLGLCIHSMIGGELDNGDIIARDYHPITLQTKITDLWEWMYKRIPSLYCEALSALEYNPKFVLQKQSTQPMDTLRCYPRKPEDGRIDWTKSATDTLRLINACNKPYAGAFCLYQGKPLIIWDAELAPPENFLAIPGQITEIGNHYIDVACGEGKLRVKKIEYEHKVSSPNEIITSTRVRWI